MGLWLEYAKLWLEYAELWLKYAKHKPHSNTIHNSQADPSADLVLSTEQKKQLSSKFLHRLQSAPQVAKDAYEQATKGPPGTKQKAIQQMVKAWVLDRSWGHRFISIMRTLEFTQALIEKEKPATWKQLSDKYIN